MGTTEKRLARAVQAITGSNYTTALQAVRNTDNPAVGKAIHLDTTAADNLDRYVTALNLTVENTPLQTAPWADIVFVCGDCATLHAPEWDSDGTMQADRYNPMGLDACTFCTNLDDTAQTPKAVWVLSILHRHGEDITVHTTEENALGALHKYVTNWWDEVDCYLPVQHIAVDNNGNERPIAREDDRNDNEKADFRTMTPDEAEIAGHDIIDLYFDARDDESWNIEGQQVN